MFLCRRLIVFIDHDIAAIVPLYPQHFQPHVVRVPGTPLGPEQHVSTDNFVGLQIEVDPIIIRLYLGIFDNAGSIANCNTINNSGIFNNNGPLNQGANGIFNNLLGASLNNNNNVGNSGLEEILFELDKDKDNRVSRK